MTNVVDINTRSRRVAIQQEVARAADRLEGRWDLERIGDLVTHGQEVVDALDVGLPVPRHSLIAAMAGLLEWLEDLDREAMR